MKHLFTFLFICASLFSFGQEKIRTDPGNAPAPPISCHTYPPLVDSTSFYIYTFDDLDEKPKFSKGNLNEYLSNYMEYTERAMYEKIEGILVISFVIEKDGSVTNTIIVSNKLGYGLDEIFIRAIRKTNKLWIPARIKGKNVRSFYKVAYEFKLP